MKHTIHITADGSSTLFSERFGAHYHSLHGAMAESQHVFIGSGLHALNKRVVKVLEVGFGTGLNVALTAYEAISKSLIVEYHSLELYPLQDYDYESLNYEEVLTYDTAILWRQICQLPWNEIHSLFDGFTLHKEVCDFTKWKPINQYNLIFFDAFAPNDQPEMWERDQFVKLFSALESGGCLVTYCVKGTVKEALRQVGFRLERLPGPPGKKHILRAWKE